MIGKGTVILVELYLEVVAVAVHGRNCGKGCISLSTYTYAFKGFSVNHYGSYVVFRLSMVYTRPNRP